MKILSGHSYSIFAKNLSAILAVEYVTSYTKIFTDGEFQVQISKDVANEDIVIVQSTSKPVNDNLMELLLLIDAAKQAGAATITTIIPYLGYCRQNHIFRKGQSLSAKLVINLLEVAGVNRIITLDIHSQNIETFSNEIKIHNICPTSLIVPLIRNVPDLAIISPDKGGKNRAANICSILSLDLVKINKDRDNNGNITNQISGSVEGRNCFIIDDIIDTGQTLYKTALLLRQKGALSISAFITHSVLSLPIEDYEQDLVIESIYTTNSIIQDTLPSKFKLLSTEKLIVEYIKSIQDLLE